MSISPEAYLTVAAQERRLALEANLPSSNREEAKGVILKYAPTSRGFPLT